MATSKSTPAKSTPAKSTPAKSTPAKATPAKVATPAPAPETSAGFTPITPASYIGAQTVLGEKVPATSPNLAGPVVAGSAPLANQTFQATPQPTTTPVYGPTGGISGYTTTTYNWDGSPLGSTYTAAPAVVTGATGPTGPTGRSSAFDTFKARFAAMGLGSLADSLISLSQSADAPTTSDGYYLALLNTPEYKARFGDTNAARIANGLPALTEAQIMNNEQEYQKVMKQYGLPAGFYDQPSDYKMFMATDKSPAEVASIVQAYTNLASQQDPAVLANLKTYYNLDVGHVAANLMDPTKAQPIINALTQNGTIAAAAGSAGIQDVTTAAQMAQGMGAGALDYAKQAQAFAQAAVTSGQITPLTQRYAQLGVNYNLASGLQEALSGPEAVQAEQARKRLTTAETSEFGGSAGADTRAQSLGIGTAQGIS